MWISMWLVSILNMCTCALNGKLDHMIIAGLFMIASAIFKLADEVGKKRTEED